MDEFEEDFNPRAFENPSNGSPNHQSNNNSLLNGQSGSGSNFFAQTNGLNSAPLCKWFPTIKLYFPHYEQNCLRFSLFFTVAPPPKSKDSRRQNGAKEDLFGSVPFNPAPFDKNDFKDPFEMGEFGSMTSSSGPSQQELENAIGLLDKKLLEMKVTIL